MTFDFNLDVGIWHFISAKNACNRITGNKDIVVAFTCSLLFETFHSCIGRVLCVGTPTGWWLLCYSCSGNGIVLVDDSDFSNWFLSSVISLRIKSVRLWNPIYSFSSIMSEVPVVLTIWPINIDFSSETFSNDFCNVLFSSLRVNASAVSSESFAFSVYISFSCRLFFSISFWSFSFNVLFSSLRNSDSCRSFSFSILKSFDWVMNSLNFNCSSLFSFFRVINSAWHITSNSLMWSFFYRNWRRRENGWLRIFFY